ncbi:E3 ubiquitin ligase complex SCF subunit sconC [Araneus ventricosus]|uniref:E3 ubiquitin ligase complex SCF subunit sconC n=1 Tax=Araneus ventricosus TaxID=182803 RepID=A0A4Y2CJ02_ARAVE|nr:E3 ubiquitin ligase complex SCF subunit sconC [Araneus ventricosus]
MSKVKPSANDKTVNVDQKDASEVETADDKTSNGKMSDGSRKVPMVKFVSADGKSFYVEEKVSRKFKFADEKTEHVVGSGESGPVEKIDSEILTIMIKWAEQHVNDPETNSDAEDAQVKRTDDMDEWDKELLDLDVETLFRLMHAARIAQMGGLSNVLLKKLASMIKGRTPDEIRKTFNITKITEEQMVKKRDEKFLSGNKF